MLNQLEDGLAAGTDYDTSPTILLEEDRISGLPDEILGHILSQLWTTQAVQTSILSKRWKHAWTNIRCVRLSITRHGEIINMLHGRYSTMPRDLLFPSFFNFVDEILKYFCHGPGRGLFREFIYVDLQTLAEETAYDERIMSHIRDALCCDIEHLKLEPRRGTILRPPFPNSLLVTSPSLRVLDWSALLYPWFPFYREIPAEPTFIALRELTLRGIIFNILSSMGAKVFLGCPNLETLVLYKCWMVKCDDGELEINIPSLIKLVIHHPYLLPSGTLIVASTPRLARFKYLGCHPLVCCVRNNNMPFDMVEMDTERCPNSCPNSGKNPDIMILIDAIRELCRARSFRLCKKILNKLLLETSGIAKELLLKEAKSQECSQWFYITAELQRLIREAGISPLARA